MLLSIVSSDQCHANVKPVSERQDRQRLDGGQARNDSADGLRAHTTHQTGTNTGLVVKTVKIDYRRPVTFPDQLAIYSIPVDINKERASFGLKQIAWSLEQRDVVARCERWASPWPLRCVILLTADGLTDDTACK